MTLAVGICLLPIAHADVLTLQSGKIITGHIIQRTGLNVMVDVHGLPETFYWGEITAIDGKSPQSIAAALASPKKKVPVTPVAAKEKKPILYNKDEVDSLMRSMAVRDPNGKTPTSADKIKVIPTPDGGFVIVGPQKITKYDKNLNFVKAINIDGN